MISEQISCPDRKFHVSEHRIDTKITVFYTMFTNIIINKCNFLLKYQDKLDKMCYYISNLCCNTHIEKEEHNGTINRRIMDFRD